MHSDAVEVQKHIRTYLTIGIALLVLTVVTVAVSYVNLGTAGNITVGLLIATLKASMVAAVFMHLNHERAWIYGSLVLTVVFFVVLLALPSWSNADTTGMEQPFATLPMAAPGAHAGH